MKFKKTNYKFWHSPFALIILFCFLVFFGYRIVDLIQKNIETKNKKEDVLNRIDDLKEREASLSVDINKLGTEEGQEEIIREKYQVAKAGEKVVTIVDEDNKSGNTISGRKTHGFWNWIKGIFKK
jgi:cell division protein FtsB